MTTREMRMKIMEGILSLPPHYQNIFNRRYCPNNDITIPIEETVRRIRPALLESAISTVSSLSKQFAISVLDK